MCEPHYCALVAAHSFSILALSLCFVLAPILALYPCVSPLLLSSLYPCVSSSLLSSPYILVSRPCFYPRFCPRFCPRFSPCILSLLQSYVELCVLPSLPLAFSLCLDLTFLVNLPVSGPRPLQGCRTRELFFGLQHSRLVACDLTVRLA